MKRIAVIVLDVRLADEVKGYSRIPTVATMLAQQGYDVDLITSSFQHWEKKHRDISDPKYAEGTEPFHIVFIDEPAYGKNIDLKRIRSHQVATRNIKAYLESQARSAHPYDLIYVELPPNKVARAVAEHAHAQGIPLVGDVKDLWPEAMRMVFDVPVLSDLLFTPFRRDAAKAYQLMDAVIGTSDEYATRGLKDNPSLPHYTVYVGNDLAAYDAGAAANADAVPEKPEGEFWCTYAGTLGTSYDIGNLIKAADIIARRAEGEGYAGNDEDGPNAADSSDDSNAEEGLDTDANAEADLSNIVFKILGGGPEEDKLHDLAKSLGGRVDFVGYQPYEVMAAWLKASDLTINSYVKKASQSIVTKIGDYLAAGIPMVSTCPSKEFWDKVEADGFGVNVEPEEPEALAQAIIDLYRSPETRAQMGAAARRIAEEQFDRPKAYQTIMQVVKGLLGD